MLELALGVLSTSGCWHAGRVSRHDEAIAEVRAQLREHFSALSNMGRDPLAGTAWGPLVDRLDTLLRELAEAARLPDVHDSPWTMTQRVEIDEACRRAGLIVGPELLP